VFTQTREVVNKVCIYTIYCIYTKWNVFTKGSFVDKVYIQYRKLEHNMYIFIYLCVYSLCVYTMYVILFSQIWVLYILLNIDEHFEIPYFLMSDWMWRYSLNKYSKFASHSFSSMTLLMIFLLLCIIQNKVSFHWKELLHAFINEIYWVNGGQEELNREAWTTMLASKEITLILIYNLVFIYDTKLHQGPQCLTRVPSVDWILELWLDSKTKILLY
jgi:hypothetical protein